MPAMAAMTVKRADNSTDVVFNVKTSSAGDGTWAYWRQDTGNGAPYNARQTFGFRVSEGAKGVRRCDMVFNYPYWYLDGDNQVVLTPLVVKFQNGSWVVPQGVPVGHMEEAQAEFSNICNHALIREGLRLQTSFV